MSELVDPAIEQYAAAHSTPQPARLEALYRETVEQLGFEQMLSGALVGRLLELIVRAVRPALVVEVGTFSGYSAQAMAAGLPPEGRIITLEFDPDRATLAQRHIDAGPYADRIELRVGDARETLRAVEGPVDLAFVDADKASYPEYVRMLLEKLSPHGLILADNTLYGGEVLRAQDPQASDNARAMHAFNEALATDERLVVVQLTVRDGITMIGRR